MIGVLIALQINNWNKARKERNKEVNYLKNLKADLVSEIKNNEEFVNYKYHKAKAYSELINGYAPTSIEEVKTYTETFGAVFIWNTFVPNQNTYKELLSSDNLSLIKSDSVKNGLLELDKLYAAIKTGEEHMRREYEAYIYDPQAENVTNVGCF
ncbi:hypothetical protein KCG49_11770 [Winogradskyella sp. WHY3]|uniref:Uncharacterized protein n=1 Tax=Winogradskyella luteola TaxID=2828330 RepID=A0A9X1F9M6_9FLAO|nr:hypothetical protein [Winogradskyella luteola]